MKIKELLDIANEGYDDGWLAQFYDDEGNFVESKNAGDTLARFIVIELIETFDPKASDESQLSEARLAMANAMDDVDGVRIALEKKEVEAIGRSKHELGKDEVS